MRTVLSLFWLAVAVEHSGMAQNIEMTKLPVEVRGRIEISRPSGGWYPWYEVHADPADPATLIVCATRWNARENAFSGVLYSSTDAGRTWRTALEDKNSNWVSEHSCAFGVNGRAYFVSTAARVIDGRPGQGRTRIFVSNDAGRTWGEAALTGSLDYSSSVVDTHPGLDENRLYTVFNDLVLKPGDATGEQGGFSLVGLLSFRDGDQNTMKAPISEDMASLRYQGSYPERALILRNGSLLTLYWAGFNAEDGSRRFMIGAVHTDRSRSTFSAPVELARDSGADTGNGSCHATVSTFAATYDPAQDKVYVAYTVSENGNCKIMLKTSVTDGSTWSKEDEIILPSTTDVHFYSPAMAFNRDGVLGLMWRDEPVSDCWYFSASSDRGKSFTPPQALSLCSTRRIAPLTESNASLRMAGILWIPPQQSKPESGSGQFALGLDIVDSRNHAWRTSSSLTATSDGTFHPVWIEAGSGEGQLRTAAVIVGTLALKPLRSLQLQDNDSRDVSQDVTLLYGGDQHYDISSDTLTVDVVLKNNGTSVISGPLVLNALTLDSTLGKIEIANATNGLFGPGAVWDLSKTLPGGELQPGASTMPYPLVFRVPSGVAPPEEAEVVSMRLKVIASPASDSATAGR